MEKVFISVAYFMIIFTLSFFVFLYVNRKRKTYKTGKKHIDINYLIDCGSLDMTKSSYKTVKWCSTIIDCFVISFSCAILIHVDNFIWKMTVGFIVLMVSIYSLYNITGRVLKWKEKK
ncbi:MAG: hypothetical protein RSD96_01755 [Bacilli bacterium]